MSRSIHPALRQIVSVEPINGVTNVELVRLSLIGQQTFSPIGLFKPGDLCVWLPLHARIPKENPTFEKLGLNGRRIRKKVLHKIVSNGVAIPLVEFSDDFSGLPVGTGLERWIKLDQPHPLKPKRDWSKRRFLQPWMKDPTTAVEERDALAAQPVPYCAVFGETFPQDMTNHILAMCNTATLGLIALTKRGTIAQYVMSRVSRLIGYDSNDKRETKFLRLCLAVFGHKIFDYKYRLGSPRNLRQVFGLKSLAEYTDATVPSQALLSAANTVTSLHIASRYETRQSFIVANGFFGPIATTFVNLTSLVFEPGAPMGRNVVDIAAISTLKLEKLILPVKGYGCTNFTFLDESKRPDEDLGQAEEDDETRIREFLWSSFRNLTTLNTLEIATISPEISQLTRLTSLRTYYPTDYILSWKSFSTLTKLVHLVFVHARQFQGGPWAVRDIQALSHLTNLETLRIPFMDSSESQCSSSLIRAFSFLPKLRSLSLRENGFLTDLPYGMFDACKDTLTDLNIDGCRLTCLEALETLSRLKRFNVRDLLFSHTLVSTLSRMTQLETLDWPFKEGISSIASGLGSYGNLRSISFEPDDLDNHLHDRDLAHLSAITSLTNLHVHSRQVTAAGFEHLTNLRDLKKITMYCPKLRKAQVQALFPSAQVEH